MTVGDIIVYGGAAAGGYRTFTPAVGTEIIITGIFGQGVFYIGINDGVNSSVAEVTPTVASGGNASNVKIGITNTQSITGYSGSGTITFTGIQTK